MKKNFIIAKWQINMVVSFFDGRPCEIYMNKKMRGEKRYERAS